MRVLLAQDEVRLAENVRRGLAAEDFVVDSRTTGTTACSAPRSTATTSWCSTSSCPG
jgi:DNA-binding response OmpR family regulator